MAGNVRVFSPSQTSETKYRYIHSRSTAEEAANCTNRRVSIPKGLLENKVMEVLIELSATDPGEIIEAHKDRTKEQQIQIEQAEKALVRVEADKVRAHKLRTEGEFTAEAYRSELARLDANKAELEEDIERLSRVAKPTYLDWIVEDDDYEKVQFEIQGQWYFSNEEWFELMDKWDVLVEVVKPGKKPINAEILLYSNLVVINKHIPMSRVQ